MSSWFERVRSSRVPIGRPTALVVVFLASVLLKLAFLPSKSLSWDELETLLELNGIGYKVSFDLERGFTSGDFQNERSFSNSRTALIQRDSGNGLVYLTVVYPWLKFWGNSAAALRAVSLLFSLLCVLVVYRLAQEVFGKREIAVWSAMVFSFHAVAVQYAQEGRPYTMATFFCLLGVWFFFRLRRCHPGRATFDLMMLGVTGGLAILTHYFAAIIFFALIAIAVARERRAMVWKNLLLSGCISTLIVFAWLPMGGVEGLEYMSLRNERYQILAASDVHHSFYGKTNWSKSFIGFFQMQTHLFCIGFQNAGLRVRYSSLFLLLPVLLLLANRGAIRENFENWLNFFLLVFCVPAVALMLAFISGHMVSFQTLYLNFSVPFASVVIGWLISSSISRTQRKGVFAVAIVYMIVILFSNYSNVNLPLAGPATPYVDRAAQIESRCLESAGSCAQDTVRFLTREEALYTNLFLKRTDIVQKVTGGSDR